MHHSIHRFFFRFKRRDSFLGTPFFSRGFFLANGDSFFDSGAYFF
jgi:hypothetical protein